MGLDMAVAQHKKKTTVELPEVLLKEALAVSGKSINETIVMGLKLIAARRSFERLRAQRGKFKSGLDLNRLRSDE